MTDRPAAMVTAWFAELLTSFVDQRIDRSGIKLPIILDRGAPEDLRTMLATIASSSITILALVLSLTLVTISLSGTQFGPRLVRMFLHSRSLKLVVSLYAGLFVYAIMVLDSLNTSEVPSRRLIPDIGDRQSGGSRRCGHGGSDRPRSRACPWCPRSPGTSSRSSTRR